jgi:nucleotide-binding universal stress UspA family protein
MFKRIMVPVDLSHAGSIEKALRVAGDIAKSSNADLVLVGATTTEPSAIAHNPEEFAEKLAEFGTAAAERLGCTVHTEMIRAHDLRVELDKDLIEKAGEMGVDLAVMATHKPGALEHLFSSNAGYLANHAPFSVMVVRD